MPLSEIEKPEKADRHVYAFMPAALEIQETPPSPIGRLISWMIVLLFVLAVAWGFYGKIDVVAVAHGKIIPIGRVKTIQPLEIGIVKSQHIREGQQVKAGETLITLDNTLIQAETKQLRQKLAAATVKLTRQEILQFLLGQSKVPENWLSYSDKLFQKISIKINPGDVLKQKSLLKEEINEYRFRREALENELQKLKAEQDQTVASITEFQRTLPLVTERAEAYRVLMQDGIASRHQFLEIEQMRISREQGLKKFQAQFQELEAAAREINSELEGLKAETQKNNLHELNKTSQEYKALKQELVKSHQRNRQQTLTSPIDGTVQQLAIHTVGGIVTPAQELMQIVPEETILEVEAFVLNKDIGFVEEGQVVEVKIDTFDFTKYGTIDGQIIDLSNDAIQDDDMGLVYLARVQIDKAKMRINKKWVNLGPGMSVTVEIKTGKRRLIEYFLSPLLKYKQESIRER
ncbi:MAG: HlyD family type I secretion periplasmic adaptor subunit [Nitrospina sp.]|nr:HlyD family type I secretion periplasmic adaptor subunit [Nitrospina sp.]